MVGGTKIVKKVENWSDMEALLGEAIGGLITCPDCGSNLEPDAEKCSWESSETNLELLLTSQSTHDIIKLNKIKQGQANAQEATSNDISDPE